MKSWKIIKEEITATSEKLLGSGVINFNSITIIVCVVVINFASKFITNRAHKSGRT